MTTRLLKGASGNLYEAGSEANHRALQELWSVMDHLGFKVVKKLAKESTLRAYPLKIWQYPLLNPRFEPDAAGCAPAPDVECLDVTVLSKGDGADLDRHLREFPSESTCFYVPDPFTASGYNGHGRFILPLLFSGEQGNEEIDFTTLGIGLAAILHHLRQHPVTLRGQD